MTTFYVEKHHVREHPINDRPLFPSLHNGHETGSAALVEALRWVGHNSDRYALVVEYAESGQELALLKVVPSMVESSERPA